MFNITDINRMSSTLVETVSINYEDFNDSFLTCGTCLCNYDAEEHTPKLLPCSHTVCKNCLERIVEASRERSQIRCPICRGSVPMPAGGVGSFPPSFLVNQLLDLMARQRRDIIPKCTLHPAQELMFCESCDQVFCMDCTGGSHNGRGASAHTVIPFSIAIKRMSEILLYKATQCMKNLDRAAQVVSEEIDNVQESGDRCMDTISQTFADILSMVEDRRRELIRAVQRVCEDKKRVLQEQLDIIENEKQKVQTECQGLQQQVEVRNITKKIGDLNEKLDMSSNLVEPRENAFVKLEFTHNSAILDLKSAMDTFGRIRISKTFPALCTAKVDPPTIHLKTQVTVTTVDYHGNARNSGSDPLVAKLNHESGDAVPCSVVDHNTGKYSVGFTPNTAGRHTLSLEIFGRPIRDSPLSFDVTSHHNPVARVGNRGSGELQFVQPISVVIDCNQNIYVLDTGNSRIKVLTADLRFANHIGQHGLEEHSGTGLALTPSDTLVAINWRTKHVSELNSQGEVINKFTCVKFVEPISITVNRHGEIIVADNGLGQLLVFDAQGTLVSQIGSRGDKPGQMKLISSVYAIPHSDNILVTDHRLQLFTRKAKFIKEIHSNEHARGRYGGVTVDHHGNILATHQGKSGGTVLYFSPDGQLKFAIDSHEDRLKRPSGLATTRDGHVFVVDLGNDALKKYRYQ